MMDITTNSFRQDQLFFGKAVPTVCGMAFARIKEITSQTCDFRLTTS